MYLLLSDSLVFATAVIVEAANVARAELVRAALEAAKQKGLDSAATGFSFALPSGLGELDALGNATTR